MHSATVTRLRGPSGLGDAIYLRPIAEHLARAGKRVRVVSNYPDVFRSLDVEVEPFTRQPPADITAHYVGGKNDPLTNQFQDMCRAAKVPDSIPLRFDWKVRDGGIHETVRARAAGRRIVLVHGGRSPMARTDGFGAELLPRAEAFGVVLDHLAAACFLVRIGHGPQLYRLRSELDLWGQTSIADLFDLAATCDAVVGPCSFAVPLAESFGKPLLAVWAADGLKSRRSYVKTITPKKIFTSASSRYVMDDWPAEKIREVADALRRV